MNPPLERIGDMPKLHPAGPNDNADDVEPDLYRAGPSVRQPRRCETTKPRLFRISNGLRRFAPAIGPTGLHLAEDDQRAPTDDKVDFASPAAIVPLENEEAGVPVHLGGCVLARSAQIGARVHARDAT